MRKAALFIDFDNIYSGLARVAPAAADAFATDPAGWLHWLETGMPAEDAPADTEPRRVLVRRCYLNPRVYQKYRAYFVLAGFDVVDCPPLTQQGKTSADIRMAMDVLDMLSHQTFFDEFVILSGDADFTPVLLRLRAHDRRTVILAVGFAAQAYKAACDIVINESTFIENALGILEGDGTSREGFEEDGEPPRSVPRGADNMEQILDSIARDIALAAARGPLASAELPSIYRRQAAFRASNDWLGFGTLRSMTESVVSRRNDLAMSPGNPWTVSVRTAMTQRPPSYDTIVSSSMPAPSSMELLEQFARRISQVTGAPLLRPTVYAALFRITAEYLCTHAFNLYSASKDIIDIAASQGVEVSRSHLVFILRGIAYGGADLTRAPADWSATELGRSFRDNVLSLCVDRGLILSEEENLSLDKWLVRYTGRYPRPESTPVPTEPQEHRPG